MGIKILLLIWIMALLMTNIFLCIKMKKQYEGGNKEYFKTKVLFVVLVFTIIILAVTNVWREPYYYSIVWLVVTTILIYNFNRNSLNRKQEDNTMDINNKEGKHEQQI